MFVSAFAALFICEVKSHGFISNPEARGIGGSWNPGPPHPYKTEPQSAGATGPGDPIPVCGRDDSGAISRRPDDPFGVITAGQSFEFKAHITAHHMGHMTVRICPFIDSTFTVSRLSECVTVNGTDGQGPFWWLSPNTGDKTWSGDIPALANLPETSIAGAYTVQWRWNTANSCCPQKGAYQLRDLPATWCYGPDKSCRDYSVDKFGDLSDVATDLYDGTSGDDECSETICCSEVFTNCADVALAGESPTWPDPPPPTPAPGPAPGPAPAGTQPDPDSESEPTSEAGRPCVHNTDSATNAWWNDPAMPGHCANHDETNCPSPQCTLHPQAALVQVSPHFTKFSGKIQQDVGRRAIAANGEIADISDDDA